MSGTMSVMTDLDQEKDLFICIKIKTLSDIDANKNNCI